MVLIFALTVVVFVLLYFGPYRNPGWLSPGFAGSLCLFGIAAFSTGEFIREAVRKPFVVYNVVLGNQILPEEVPRLREDGYLEGGVWTKAFVAEHYPQVMVDETATRSTAESTTTGCSSCRTRTASRSAEVLFLYHCNDCHAADAGYSAVGPLLQGWPRDDGRSTDRAPRRHLLHAALVRHAAGGRAADGLPDDASIRRVRRACASDREESPQTSRRNARMEMEVP